MKRAISTLVLLLMLSSVIAVVFNAHPAKANGLIGDVNGDGRVDGLDVVGLAKYYGSVSGDGRYDAKYDLSNDGKVDGKDIAILATNFGKAV